MSLADHADLALVAAELGYADQAHLQHEFRDIVGITPGAYVRSLRTITDGSHEK